MPYPRAPITEAVLDIRVEPREGLEVRELETLNGGPFADYSGVEEQYQGVARLTVGKDPHADIEQTITGLKFSHKDKQKLFMAREEGFSFNKLFPYESWEKFSSEARGIWNRYREITQPKKIKRVALRYINRLDIPLPLDDFSTYVRTFPEISQDLPQAVSSFFMQMHIPQQDIGAMLILNTAMTPPAKEDAVSLILDLDLYRDKDIPQKEEELWLYFEQLRLKKNEAFEACITDSARELFQ